jgi:hypothetical protein
LYSRFHTDPIYDNSFLADIHELSLQTGEDRRITKEQRVISPAFWNGSILAGQTSGQTRSLVVIDPVSGAVSNAFLNAVNSTFITAAPGSGSDADAPVAVLGKKNGVQAIWFEDLTAVDELFGRDPDIVFEDASIFDPAWNETGDRLYFSADNGDAMNIYEYDTVSEDIRQVTDSRYIAMEGDMSPDGSRLAYIYQKNNEQLAVVLEADDFYNKRLTDTEWGLTENVEAELSRPLLNRPGAGGSFSSGDVEASDYSTGLGWLKPRIWQPVVEDVVDNFDQIGLSLESADLMGQNSYALELTYFRKGLWFDGTYRYKGVYPGFELNMYNRPSISIFRFRDGNDQSLVLPTIAQQRGGTFSVPFRYRLEQNTRFSSFIVEPEFSVTQVRFTDFNDATLLISEYEKPLYTLGFNTTLSLGLRQHTRDVQPNRGLQLFTQTRYGLNSSEFSLQLPGGVSTNPLSSRKGFRAGAVWYVAPLSRFNQSLRVSAQGFTQTSGIVFNTESVISNLFETGVTGGATNTGILDTRYTIPLIYPDDGGLFLPVYLSNIYMVLFTQTVADLKRVGPSARTLLGAGIRSKFKVGNLQFDIGISVGWEPSRNRVDYLIGSF